MWQGEPFRSSCLRMDPGPSYSISDGRQPDGVKGTLVSEVKFLDRHETS